MQRERLYFSKAIIGRGTSMGNFRNAFSRGDPFADRPTLVHSRNDGRRPTDSAKTWAHPDTQCEGERVSLPPVSGSSAADSNEMNLCKWQIWRGTKVGRGGEEGLSSSSYLRLSSSQFAHGVRPTVALGDVANQAVLLPLPFLLPLTLRANSLCPPPRTARRSSLVPRPLW